MKKRIKFIAISTRIVNSEVYFEPRDALSHEWPKLLEKLGYYPIFISNFFSDVKTILNETKIDGIILSGGDNIGESKERDKIERKLIKIGLENKIPIFGVCRGMQVINDYFKGTIEKTNDKKHVKTFHTIKINDEKFKKSLKRTSIRVNSFHNNIIKEKNLGKGIQSFAITKSDNTVEGLFHKDFQIMGVMWHPERSLNNINKKIIKNFFEKKII